VSVVACQRGKKMYPFDSLQPIIHREKDFESEGRCGEGHHLSDLNCLQPQAAKDR
jgi:hypothetical protein